MSSMQNVLQCTLNLFLYYMAIAIDYPHYITSIYFNHSFIIENPFPPLCINVPPIDIMIVN